MLDVWVRWGRWEGGREGRGERGVVLMLIWGVDVDLVVEVGKKGEHMKNGWDIGVSLWGLVVSMFVERV